VAERHLLTKSSMNCWTMKLKLIGMTYLLTADSIL